MVDYFISRWASYRASDRAIVRCKFPVVQRHTRATSGTAPTHYNLRGYMLLYFTTNTYNPSTLLRALRPLSVPQHSSGIRISLPDVPCSETEMLSSIITNIVFICILSVPTTCLNIYPDYVLDIIEIIARTVYNTKSDI